MSAAHDFSGDNLDDGGFTATTETERDSATFTPYKTYKSNEISVNSARGLARF
jgi:hypothetical protein